MIKTTKHHFQLFKKACEKWIDIYGLLNYAVSYSHEHLDGRYAECYPNTDSRICLITLSTEWDNYRNPTKHELEICARHEVHHLLLEELMQLALGRHSSKDEIERAEHAIIRRLDNVIGKLNGE